MVAKDVRGMLLPGILLLRSSCILRARNRPRIERGKYGKRAKENGRQKVSVP
jgi:hypothetical protein